MLKPLLASSLLAIMMQGCFTSEPPKCSDDDVKVTLNEVYGQLFTNSQQNIFLAAFMKNLPKNIDSFSSIRATAYDETVKMRSCKADVTFENNQTATIEYSVQLNEENSDEFYVELNPDFLEGLMQQSFMQGILSK